VDGVDVSCVWGVGRFFHGFATTYTYMYMCILHMLELGNHLLGMPTTCYMYQASRLYLMLYGQRHCTHRMHSDWISYKIDTVTWTTRCPPPPHTHIRRWHPQLLITVQMQAILQTKNAVPRSGCAMTHSTHYKHN